MSTAIEKIRQFIDYQGISERKFYIQTGLPEGSFNKIKSIGSENLKKIFSRYPELNMDWVITGRGKMMYSYDIESVVNEEKGGYNEKKINWEKKYYETLELYTQCLQEQTTILKNNQLIK